METADPIVHYDDPSRYHEKGRSSDKRLEVERQLSSRWLREELEDKYLRLYAENQELKEHKVKQQEKIKILTTKLDRLLQDKRKLISGDEGGSQFGGAGQVGYNVQELQDQVVALRAHNDRLKSKVDLLTSQLKNAPKGTGPQHVQSKINTGIAKADTLHQSRGLQATGGASGMRSISPLVPKATRQMIEELRSENSQLRGEMIRLQHTLEEAHVKIDDGKKKLNDANIQYQEDLAKIKQAMGTDQRNSIKANIEQINLQRDLKDRTAKLQLTSDKMRQLESQVEQFKLNEKQLRREVDKLQTELKLEQERRTVIDEELKSTSAVARAAPELETKLSDFARENVILKETNDRLTQSAFDVDRERNFVDREQAYRIQIQQLEATLKADVGEKTLILEKMTEERTNSDKMRQELKDEKAKAAELKHELDNLTDKMKIFSKASAVDFDELGEALMLIRERKRAASVSAKESSVMQSVSNNAQEAGPKDWKKLYEELEIVQAETVQELDRTRAILSVQYRINKDYAQEVEATTRRLDSVQTESEQRLQEYARLLDLRLARIKKLEARLRDLAYGVRPLRPIAMVSPAGADASEQKGELEAGQNLFEIHLDSLRVSSDTLRLLNETEMPVFCTWGFFEFELQKSPVVRSYNGTALFDCTSQYIVTVDDFFLSYLAHRPLIIELHRSRGGLDYETIATARLSLRELLDSQESTCRMAGTVPFTGLSGVLEAIQVGELDFWVLLRVPMQHAFRLFRERLKALNYLVSDARSRDAAKTIMETGGLAANVTGTDANVNILHVHIIRCQGLAALDTAARQAAAAGTANRQPSAYVAYKLLDFPEHVTATVPDSAAPQFNDHQQYTLYTTVDTDRFLKTEALQLFVFDDVSTDPNSSAYLGRVRIPLISLANNAPVQGLFELTRADGTASGTVEVRLNWQFAYCPPSNMVMVPPPAIGPDAEMPEVPVRDVDAQMIKTQQQQQQQHRPQTSMLLGKSMQTQELQANLPPGTSQQPTTEVVAVQPIQPVQPAAPAPLATMSTPAPLASSIQIVSETPAVVSPPAPVEVSPAPVVEPPPVVSPPVQSPPEAMSPPAPSVPESAAASVPPESKAPSETGSQPEVIFESDSEGVVVETSRLPKSVRQSLDQVISITIHSLTIKADTDIDRDDKITQLFVAFDFGGIAQEELETPLSLPKPTSGQRDLLFNFQKTIPVSPVKNPQSRAYLAGLLNGTDKKSSSIAFSVVNESPNSDECYDIAEALVDTHTLLEQDIREKDFEVRSIGGDNSVVGTMKITVIGQEVLRSIHQDAANQPQNLGQSGAASPPVV